MQKQKSTKPSDTVTEQLKKKLEDLQVEYNKQSKEAHDISEPF